MHTLINRIINNIRLLSILSYVLLRRFSSQAGTEADATAEVRAYQETKEQATAGFQFVARAAAGRQSADHSVATGQDQPTEPGYSASTSANSNSIVSGGVQQNGDSDSDTACGFDSAWRGSAQL